MAMKGNEKPGICLGLMLYNGILENIFLDSLEISY
jgi:hypothetical protein